MVMSSGCTLRAHTDSGGYINLDGITVLLPGARNLRAFCRGAELGTNWAYKLCSTEGLFQGGGGQYSSSRRETGPTLVEIC